MRIFVLLAFTTLAAAGAHTLVPEPRSFAAAEGFFAPGTNALAACVRFLHEAALPSEGYRMEVTPRGITVTSADEAGAFWALQTLAQLEVRDETGVRRVPCAWIDDAPCYRWRAFMLDESRHFFGKETVKKLLDLMAFHKMNVFHWHLTDDQGWRLEIKGHPELVQWGAVRPESPRHGAPDEGNGQQYGPFFYTQEDVREIVAYAKARHVTVMPEVDFPGHVRSVLAAHPEFSCVGEGLKPRAPRCRWGVDEDVLCVGNDAALTLFEDVLDEVCALFDSPVIHVGGDECPVMRWKTCPKCQARKRAENLPDERSLQAWVTRRFADRLRRKGRRIAGWDEIADRPVPADALVTYWRTLEDNKAGRRAAAAGHEIVAAPQHRYYVSTFQGLSHEPVEASEFTKRWNATLEAVYRYNPLKEFPGDLAHKVIGFEAAAWSENTWNEYDLDWKTWPRTCAIAERAWSGAPSDGTPATDAAWDGFARRMTAHRERLLARRVNCAPFAWTPLGKPCEIRLCAPTGAKIRPLNGVNNGPKVTPPADGPFGGQCCGNEELYAAARIPFARAHEAALSWYYGAEHAVDVSGIFPDFDADPDDPKSYDFPVTDKYLNDIRGVGTKVLYRLGQTIEHYVRKYGAWPPKDFDKWARICEHIIAHYNEGWADGFRWNLEYWEIWNEPDLDSWGDWKEHPHCWGGTPEQFHDFYETAAKRLKKRFPHLKIGGPGSCCREDWAAAFLKEMKRRNVPIDFFSWHLYCADPDEYAAKAKRVRAFVDAAGYPQAESILDEWNYIRNWTDEFVRSLEQGASPKGAAFACAAMTKAQEAGVDKMMYYDAGPTTPFNALFKIGSYKPLPAYYAIYAWSRLADYADELKTTGAGGDVYAAAGRTQDGRAAALVTRFSKDDNAAAEKRVRVFGPVGCTAARAHLTDSSRRFTEIPLRVTDDAVTLTLEPNAVAFVEFE